MLNSRRMRILAGLLAVVLIAAAACWGYVWWQEPGPNYTLVEPGLYLGGYVAEPPPGTAAVLNLDETKDVFRCEFTRWEPIVDAPPAPSLDWLRDQIAFVAEQRAAGHTVYVHCRNGISRSAMVVLAWQMQEHGLSRDEAIARLRLTRPQIRPNPAFMELLAEWEGSEINRGAARFGGTVDGD
jgi:hypothetical protein